MEPGETSVTGFSLVREKSYNVLKQALENAEKNYSSVRKCLNFVSQEKGVNVIIKSKNLLKPRLETLSLMTNLHHFFIRMRL